MCGINGIINFSQSSVSQPLIRTMNQTLSHRGQDSEGFFFDTHIALGHRRLAIIDLSESGKQPMLSPCGRYVLIFNGEIYNYRQIRSQIHSYSFVSQSDTEVLLAAFLQWGTDCLQHLNGMFAFAIWDKLEQKLTLARDRLGEKPLYYYADNQKLIFSSELRPLLRSGLILKKINRKVLGDYLRFQTVYAPETIIQNVFALLPAHFATFDSTGLKLQRYWNFPQQSLYKNINEKELLQTTQQLLIKSVEERLTADVPFGVFLSGGIDSSLLTGIMSQILGTKTNTFTVGFDESQFDESSYAQQIALKFGTNHNEIKLNPKDFLNLLPQALDAMDFPSGDGINSYIVSKSVRERGIKMALSGLGGDELFAGYPFFRYISQIQDFKSFFALRKLIPRQISKSLSHKLKDLLCVSNTSLSSLYPIFRQTFTESETNTLLLEPSLNTVQQIVCSQNNDLETLSKISIAEMQTYLPNILLRDSDVMSMASGLELRVPFMDYQLIEFILQVSDKQKYPHTPKQLLTQAFQDLLPLEITKRKKMGFTLPFETWMHKELFSFCEQKINQLIDYQLFNTYELQTLWTNFTKYQPQTTWNKLWHLVVLAHWIDKEL